MAENAFLAAEVGALRQGEILSGVTLYDYLPEGSEIQPKIKSFAIVVNQDCDLIQDFDRRQATGEGNLEHALLIEGQLAEVVRPTIGGRDLWKPVSQNKNERFQLFSRIIAERDACGEGLPSLMFDFRAFFSVPVPEIYRQIQAGEARRRCRLADIYRENFQQRLAAFLSRIPLPEPHTFT
jgi:hypothetical protein